MDRYRRQEGRIIQLVASAKKHTMKLTDRRKRSMSAEPQYWAGQRTPLRQSRSRQARPNPDGNATTGLLLNQFSASTGVKCWLSMNVSLRREVVGSVSV